MRLLIVADDLTGALDTGVQLSRAHIPTTVLVCMPDMEKAAVIPDCEVLSVNLETRHLSPQDAFARTKGFLEKYAISGCYVYIKTDSALRGNVGAAIAAAIAVCGAPLCFVPAYPKLGRTTRGGVCYIGGQPLAQSVFRDDPRTPATESEIPKILRATAPALTCETIPFARLDRFQASYETAPDVFLFDCESDGQITAIGDTLSQQGLYRLTAGCAGFAATFKKHLPFAKRQTNDMRQHAPLLLVSGSANAVTLSQLAYAKEAGVPVFSLADEIYNAYTRRQENSSAQAHISSSVAEQALALLAQGKSVVLAAAAAKEELRSISDPAFHETVGQTLASLVQYLIENAPPHALCVFGGDTVAAILKNLSCTALAACGEITDGVPVCTFSYGGKMRTLVTKSGAFGAPDVILQIASYFRP